jgi:hypothetical protein
MPTVKLQNGKVILKGGKVSCTCCGGPEPSCCMYPASGLGDTYTVDDLPDEVVLTYTANLGALPEADGVVFTRGGTPPVYYIATIGEDEVAIARSGDDWYYEYEGEGDGQPLSVCLIFPTFDGRSVADQFADCYEVSFPSNSVAGSFTATLTRQSLCVWISDVGGAVCGGVAPSISEPERYLITLYYDELTHKWIATITVYTPNYLDPEDLETAYWQCLAPGGGSNDTYTKISPQNTPEGDYGLFDFTDPPFATVTEC